MMPILPTLWFPNTLATCMVAITAVSDQSQSRMCRYPSHLCDWQLLFCQEYRQTTLGQRREYVSHTVADTLQLLGVLGCQHNHFTSFFFFLISPLAKDMGQIPLASRSILLWTSQTYWIQQTWLKPNGFCQLFCVPGLCRVTAKDRNKSFVYSGNWRAALTSG